MKNKGPQPLIIKKYENRRLYNTLTSQYINQDQVAQIILDDAKTPNSVFPLDVLRQMVVASGKATQESALRYMKAMMEMYQSAYRAMPSPLNAFGFMPSPWPGAENAAPAQKTPPAAPPAPETS